MLMGTKRTLKCKKPFEDSYVHFVVLDTNAPHVVCHSTYIMFLIMTFEEL